MQRAVCQLCLQYDRVSLFFSLNMALRYVRCHEPQESGYSMQKQYRQSSLVPDSDGVGTSAVVKSAKADFSGCHPVKNGARSVSIGQFGTHLSRLSA